MTKDNEAEDIDLSQQNDGDQSAGTGDQDNGSQDQQQDDLQQQDTSQENSQEDYRGKLNATNRFLEKEGYEFKDGRWHKKPDTPQEGSAPKPEQVPASPASLSRDEAIVIAKGHSLEELEHANKVAALEGCTPVEALDKDLFKDWKAKRDREAKERDAQLPASRGAKPNAKVTFATPGLSDAQHKELFLKRQGK